MSENAVHCHRIFWGAYDEKTWEILGVTRHLIIVMVMQHGGYKLMGLELDTEPTL